MRILCPHCRAESVKTADLTPTSLDIESWEIGPDGRPMPAEYGGAVACWEASQPEDPAKPYICLPCFKYLSPEMLLIEHTDDAPEPETV